MHTKIIKKTAIVLMTLMLIFVAFVGVIDTIDKMSEYKSADKNNSECVMCMSTQLMPVKAKTAFKNQSVYVGGMPFGVKLFTSGVIVEGFSEFVSNGVAVNPAASAGVQKQDVIKSINGKEINSVSDVIEEIEKSNGSTVKILIERNGNETEIPLTPKYSDESKKYKTGMWIKDSAAGIGTVTFINPENNMFAGLGHGICDTNTGELMTLSRGFINEVTISGITKGKSGVPGELKGAFTSEKIGTLLSNTEVGVFGTLSTLPENYMSDTMEIGGKDEVKEGDAYILCTLIDGNREKYEIKISEINHNESNATKNFIVRVTDPRLLSISGGIVQGMSGSPIVQSDKLVGAVTHVLINDPTSGYGIFIENMIDGMNKVS